MKCLLLHYWMATDLSTFSYQVDWSIEFQLYCKICEPACNSLIAHGETSDSDGVANACASDKMVVLVVFFRIARSRRKEAIRNGVEWARRRGVNK